MHNYLDDFSPGTSDTNHRQIFFNTFRSLCARWGFPSIQTKHRAYCILIIFGPRTRHFKNRYQCMYIAKSSINFPKYLSTNYTRTITSTSLHSVEKNTAFLVAEPNDRVKITRRPKALQCRRRQSSLQTVMPNWVIYYQILNGILKKPYSFSQLHVARGQFRQAAADVSMPNFSDQILGQVPQPSLKQQIKQFMQYQSPFTRCSYSRNKSYLYVIISQ